ncbi:MAG TPA: phospholipase D-like domain-containing protein [Ktedonobacteraceae bacterium]|jgi:phosphatidylserine/phosphatidylglycerophosphate/cardiolipin synthase-like enzyme
MAQLPFTVQRKNRFIYAIISLAFCMLFVACDANTSLNGISLGANNSTSSSGSTTIGQGTQGVQVFVEPTAGESVITNAIGQAKQSVWLELYLLTDSKVVRALEDAAGRGIDVRVMLEPHPYGGGSISPRETLDKLSAAGIKAQPTSSSFSLTHEKGLIIDGQTAYIMTCNLTLAALGVGKSTKNREYGIIDNNAQDVQAVIAIFNADWNHSNAQYNDPNLVVSPDNSRNAFASLINGAHKTLAIEAEEMQDSQIEQDLANAAQRGVQVQVILPAGSSSSESDGSDSNGQGISTIKQAGVQVEEDHHLYMHAKIIVVDSQQAFVGSENISTASLDHNRELGLIVSDQNVLTTLQQTFQQDWGASQAA